MTLIVADADQLRKALADLEAAEKNGFKHCLAVFDAGGSAWPAGIALRYSDMWERAHPTNGAMDWGRFQSVSKRNRFVKGKVVPIGNLVKE